MKIKVLSEYAILPTRGSQDAAGLDLYAALEEPIVILPGFSASVDTGISVEIPKGYFGGIYARSGLATKQGLRPSNCVGVVDADYRGAVKVVLINDSAVPRTVEPGMRIAQMIIQPYLNVEIEEATSLTETDRGAGGFGSTGV
jgi:dUTP pyrophosphatase